MRVVHKPLGEHRCTRFCYKQHDAPCSFSKAHLGEKAIPMQVQNMIDLCISRVVDQHLHFPVLLINGSRRLNIHEEVYPGLPSTATKDSRKELDKAPGFHADLVIQVHVLKNMLDTTKLRAGTPLGKCIEAVGRLLQADLDTMIEEQKLAYLVLVTDGVPSDESDSSFMVQGTRSLFVSQGNEQAGDTWILILTETVGCCFVWVNTPCCRFHIWKWNCKRNLCAWIWSSYLGIGHVFACSRRLSYMSTRKGHSNHSLRSACILSRM